MVDLLLGERSYGITVGRGVSSLVTESAAGLDPEAAFVITQEAVAPVAHRVEETLRGAGLRVAVARVPGSEEAKSLEIAGRLYDEMAEAGVHRGDLVVSVGGGVVSDIAGFVAATYHRGVAVVHVPTTLLAQVDAAIGGKTAINLRHGKNLVGAFHQPRAVLCDVHLGTKPGAKNGIDIVRQLRQAAINVPVIMIGGDRSRETVVECVQAGINDYVGDPLDRTTLLKKLARHGGLALPEAAPQEAATDP
jgi:3-dehydroquinate synthase